MKNKRVKAVNLNVKRRQQRFKEKRKYDFSKRELHWQKFWEGEHIYEFIPTSSKPLFTIDTPPITISGKLHIGHIFSYVQAEVIARFKRMDGYNVRYPSCFDDNGLPTERLTEKERGIRGQEMKREDFTKACLETINQYKDAYNDVWKSIGLSMDRQIEYSTISPEVQKISQSVFKELFDKGYIYKKDSPVLYCPECHTSVAQAEVEDRLKKSVFYDLIFKKSDGGDLIISTTRPEFLPACVAVFVNPKDLRYRNIIGSEVETPFKKKVKVFSDEKVSMEKGSGAVMCCTYGDETDVYWVKKYNLPEIIILDKDGKFTNAAGINDVIGKSVEEARKILIEKLKKNHFIKGEREIEHAVGVHERCGTPIEIITSPQWFVKILDMKGDLLKAADKINWHPAYMKKRYKEWVSGLKWDWCISRERPFGIPIPAFTCNNCHRVIVSEDNEFPLDPRIDKQKRKCPYCGSTDISGETDVLDTWFTSALTPEINNLHPSNGPLRGKMPSLSVRPHAHDIIRTWDTYTILMSLLRGKEIPWKDLMISGHILAGKGEKISKKTGKDKYRPEKLIAKYSGDAVRYAMCGVTLGQDAYFSETEIEKGKRLVTKIYNAGKFTLGHLKDFNSKDFVDKNKLKAIDQWILAEASTTAIKMKKEFEKYEFSRARQLFEDFFWQKFCDNYLEIIKNRLYNDKGIKRKSAQYALYHTYLSILKMAAPFIPHITEEMYHDHDNYFSKNEGVKSIHLSPWPKDGVTIDKKTEKGAELMLNIVSKVRKYKSTKKMRIGESIPLLTIICSKEKQAILSPFIDDIKDVSRAEKVIITQKNLGSDTSALNIVV